jgi:hypothetical protein
MVGWLVTLGYLLTCPSYHLAESIYIQQKIEKQHNHISDTESLSTLAMCLLTEWQGLTHDLGFHLKITIQIDN